MSKKYYSTRNGKNLGKFDLESLKVAFLGIVNNFKEKGYFNEYYGYECVDAGHINGLLGSDIFNFFLRQLKKKDLWPVDQTNILSYSEDDLFDVIELFFDTVSKPIEEDGFYHDYGQCGWHYVKYNKGFGWYEYQQTINEILSDYKDGYEITRFGEIVKLSDIGTSALLDKDLPKFEKGDVDQIVRYSIEKFRSRGSSDNERREAVRNLADCLEEIREDAKAVISNKDDSDIFNIANNFGIRHRNDRQKDHYNKKIWLSWMFYYYLATIHALVRLIKYSKNQDND